MQVPSSAGCHLLLSEVPWIFKIQIYMNPDFKVQNEGIPGHELAGVPENGFRTNSLIGEPPKFSALLALRPLVCLLLTSSLQHLTWGQRVLKEINTEGSGEPEKAG